MLFITHPGYPHADDVFAFSVLKAIYPDYELIRTRDTSIIESDKEAIIFDVGSKYDGVKYFDHHQAEKPMRNDKIPYSSFGLIWLHFGKKYLELKGISDVEKVWNKIDCKFVCMVDIHDNGIICDLTEKTSSEYSFFSLFTRAVDQSDEDFIYLAEYADRVLYKECLRFDQFFKNIDRVKSTPLIDNNILVFDTPMTNPQALVYHSNFSDILYTIMPRDDDSNMWQVNTVSEQRFVNKKPIAAVFVNKSEEEIFSLTGIAGVIFCHTAKFIAVTRTKDAAIQVAKISVYE